jgi:PAS domain S-box-containing protein
MSEMIEELNVTNQIIESINKDLEQLSIVASETDNAVVIMDKDGNAEWVNKAFINIYGQTLENLTREKGSNIREFSDFENISQALESVITTAGSITYSNKSQKPDGTSIYVQTTLSPVLSEMGEVNKLVAVEANITELHKAQEQILQQNIEIQKQNEEVEKQSKDILDSIHYAGRIQQALLLPEQTIKGILPEHFILFLPRDIVSGDFYWVYKIDKKIIVAAADCTGHGVPGAFMSMLGISFLNEIVIKNKITQADVILEKLRVNVKKGLHQTGENSETHDGMDISLLVFDTDKKTFEFSAAYNSVIVIRNEEPFTIKGDKMPIGVHRRDTEKFTLHKQNYLSDDCFYLYSDGYPDQISEETGRKYLNKNFTEFLVKIHKESMIEQKNLLLKEFNQWKKGHMQVDDVLVIGLKVQ